MFIGWLHLLCLLLATHVKPHAAPSSQPPESHDYLAHEWQRHSTLENPPLPSRHRKHWQESKLIRHLPARRERRIFRVPGRSFSGSHDRPGHKIRFHRFQFDAYTHVGSGKRRTEISTSTSIRQLKWIITYVKRGCEGTSCRFKGELNCDLAWPLPRRRKRVGSRGKQWRKGGSTSSHVPIQSHVP